MTQSSACLFISMLALSGCSDSPSIEIASSPLSGTIGGQAWTFQAGATDAFLSDGDDNFSAALFSTTYTPCSGPEPAGPRLFVAIPKQPGDYDLDLFRNITFVDTADHNLITIEGRIVVDTVTATTVTGGLRATYDGNNAVNGQFTVTVCPN